MPSWGSYSYAYGPIVALGMLAVLVLLLRWAFSRGTSVVAAPPRPGDPDQYGLLAPVAAPPTYAEGELMRLRLESGGVRATLAVTNDGPRLMVWPADAEQARALLAQR